MHLKAAPVGRITPTFHDLQQEYTLLPLKTIWETLKKMIHIILDCGRVGQHTDYNYLKSSCNDSY